MFPLSPGFRPKLRKMYAGLSSVTGQGEGKAGKGRVVLLEVLTLYAW